jgi:hypothetical protein
LIDLLIDHHLLTWFVSQSTAAAAAASPFLTYVTKQTNLYYHFLENFLREYCAYLESALGTLTCQ